MEPSVVIHRIGQIMEAVIGNPLVYLPLIGAWFITEMYFIIHCDEVHGHTSVVSTGIALIFTAFMISPCAIKNIAWSLFELRTLVVVALLFYGLFLVFYGFVKLFPGFLAEFFGAPGHALVPSMMGILYIEHNIAFDRLTFAIIVTPVLVLGVIKTIKRLSYRLFSRKEKE
ncbi:MAG: hypothetical protein K9M54_06065 [Kiritimatiellales bacterium]|nr:hypothetical protein [Kiritimatiellales bacterium]